MQRFYQKFICKVKQNFRESTLGNTFIVHDDTKKDKFHSNGALRRSNKPGCPKTLDGKSTTRNLTSHVWQSCILKDLNAQPTHS